MALGKVSEHILVRDEPRERDLPARWLEELLARMPESAVWRRSCQLGGGVTALVASETATPGTVLLRTALSAMLEAGAGAGRVRGRDAGGAEAGEARVDGGGGGCAEADRRRVHGMHGLWHLLRNGRCGEAVAKLGGDRIMEVLLRGLTSASWRVRNAATLALGAMVERTLGKQAERPLSAEELCRAFPTLPAAIGAVLAAPREDGGLPGRADSIALVTVLTVLGRLRLPVQFRGAQQTAAVAVVGAQVQGFLGHPSLAVRVQAAAAALRFPYSRAAAAEERVAELVNEVAEAALGQNELHGRLQLLVALVEEGARGVRAGAGNAKLWQRIDEGVEGLVEGLETWQGWALDAEVGSMQGRGRLVKHWHPMNMDLLFHVGFLLACGPVAGKSLRRRLGPSALLARLDALQHAASTRSRPGLRAFCGRLARIAATFLLDDGIDGGDEGVAAAVEALLRNPVKDVRLATMRVLLAHVSKADSENVSPRCPERALLRRLAHARHAVLRHLARETDWECRRLFFTYLSYVDWAAFGMEESEGQARRALLIASLEWSLGILEKSSDVSARASCLVACAQLIPGCARVGRATAIPRSLFSRLRRCARLASPATGAQRAADARRLAGLWRPRRQPAGPASRWRCGWRPRRGCGARSSPAQERGM